VCRSQDKSSTTKEGFYEDYRDEQADGGWFEIGGRSFAYGVFGGMWRRGW
jgi:hypothetical protein